MIASETDFHVTMIPNLKNAYALIHRNYKGARHVSVLASILLGAKFHHAHILNCWDSLGKLWNTFLKLGWLEINQQSFFVRSMEKVNNSNSLDIEKCLQLFIYYSFKTYWSFFRKAD